MVTSIRWERGCGVKHPRSAIRARAARRRSHEEGTLKWGEGRQLGRKKGKTEEKQRVKRDRKIEGW